MRPLLVVTLSVVLWAASTVPGEAQHAFFQQRDLDDATGWRLEGAGPQGGVDCLADEYKPFDDGMSSFRQGTGKLVVYRNVLFVNQLFAHSVAPGSGFSKVNFSPNLENQASSWKWTSFPFSLPVPFPSRRSLRQVVPQQQQQQQQQQYDGSSESNSYPYDSYEGGSQYLDPDYLSSYEVPLWDNSTYVYDSPSSGSPSSVTWFDGPSSSWGDFSSRGSSASFDGNTSQAIDLEMSGLAGKASSVSVCGSNITAYSDGTGTDFLFSISVEEGYCVDVTLDSNTENKANNFGYIPAAQYQRKAYYEEFGAGNPFDLQQSSVVYLAPSYEPCVSSWQPDYFPEPLGGATKLSSIDDDDYKTVSFTGGFKFRYFGQEFGSVHIGSNGFLTFVSGSISYQGTLAAHSLLPRISALMTDLNPTDAASNYIYYQQLPDRFVVTYDHIVSYDSSGPGSSFQIVLMADGAVRFTYLQVNLASSAGAVVGLSGPKAISSLVPMDISYSPTCATCGFGLPSCPPPPPLPNTLVCASGVDFSWTPQAVTVSCQSSDSDSDSGAGSGSLICDGQLSVQHLKDDDTVMFTCEGITLVQASVLP